MPTYIRLTDYKSSEEKERGFFKPENRYEAKQEDFEKIPGSPIAYWVSDRVKEIFFNHETDNHLYQGSTIGNNEVFLRFWYEPEKSHIFKSKWIPCLKGGDYRKWYGNYENVINWQNDGKAIKETGRATIRNISKLFKGGITWSRITSSNIGFRLMEDGFFLESASGGCALDPEKRLFSLAFYNTNITEYMIKIINPTMVAQSGDIAKLPIIFPKSPDTKQKIDELTQECINISKEEWDSRETSWDFRINELIRMKNEVLKAQNCKLEDAYYAYCDYWREKFFRLHANEEELNRLFIEIYGLQDELTPDVPLEDITILKNEAKIEGGELVFQKEEIVKQLISYGVGVMFGRYSLDHERLHIADMGVSLEEANEKFGFTHPTFEADDDNIIPVLEDDYFDDDIVGRFRDFLKAAFGEEYLEENIRFVEEALGKSLRKYFVKDFYEDHIKRYKKRPIYWMVSSPKHAFNALFYMHRYRPDIFARIQTGYLHEYMAKLEAKLADARRVALDESSSAKERKAAQKEITRIEKALKELRAFDNEALSHYAAQSEPIDLDDGVKVNYCRFKEILWPIKGLCK